MRWNVAEYQRTVFEHLGLHMADTAQVLDLGCGDGADADWFASRARSVVGVDLVEHPRWAQLASQQLRFLCGNGEALGFPDRSFDLIFMKDVLHHAQAPQRILREAQRICVVGGQICIVEANRVNPVFYVHMTLMLGHQHFRRAAFKRLVRSVFPQARFIHFEAHVYPFDATPLILITRAAHRLIETTPLLRQLAAYNAALVTV